MSDIRKTGKLALPFGPEDKRWEDTLPEAAFKHGEPLVTGPSQRPSHVYPGVDGIDPNSFEVPATGLTPEQHATAMKDARAYHAKQREYFLGFQANQCFPHLKGLEDYLQCQLNNLGDPFADVNFRLNSSWMERSVLDYYASLWKAKWPHDPVDPDTYWGYVLSMGSTEGNLYALWNAREYLSGQALMEDPNAEEEARRASLDGVPRSVQKRIVFGQPQDGEGSNRYTPVIFFSEDTHYSIHKAVRALGIKTFYEVGSEVYPKNNPLKEGEPWLKEIPSRPDGSIDVDKLVTLVTFFAKEGYPILVFFNYGTTFKGAYDDVGEACDKLCPVFEEYGLMNRQVVTKAGGVECTEARRGFWFHVDGALGAAYMPFLQMALKDEKLPRFDFGLDCVHSIVMSGHKWIGAPWPCGIFMTKTGFRMKPPEKPEYVGSPDTTFAGSRNGFSALLLWNYIAGSPYERQIERALKTEQMAVYAVEQLRKLEDDLQDDLWVERSPFSLTVRFKQASLKVQRKYSLSNESLWVDGVKRRYSHIFMMPHVTHDMIDELVKDLVGEIPEQRGTRRGTPPPDDKPIGQFNRRLREILNGEVWPDWSTTSLYFPPPNEEIVNKHRLPVVEVFVDGRKRSCARLEAAGLSAERLESLILDLSRPDAFEHPPGEAIVVERLGVEFERSYFYVAHEGRGFR